MTMERDDDTGELKWNRQQANGEKKWDKEQARHNMHYLYEYLDFTQAEKEIVWQAQAPKVAGFETEADVSNVISIIYQTKIVTKLVDRMIASNEKLEASNDRHS